jgi:hypothetical protein
MRARLTLGPSLRDRYKYLEEKAFAYAFVLSQLGLV